MAGPARNFESLGPSCATLSGRAAVVNPLPLSEVKSETTAVDSSPRGERRKLLVAGVVIAAVLGLAIGVYIYDHGRRDLIASGVRVADVNVGGLRTAAARARLRGHLRVTQGNWITVRYAASQFRLTGRQAHLKADVDGAVRRAVRASRSGSIVGRTFRNLFGSQVDKSIPMPVTYRHRAVDELIAHIRSTIDRPLRDATVSVDAGGQLVEVQSRTGAAVDTRRLRRALSQALSAPFAPHVVNVSVRTVKPAVTTEMLAAEHPAYVVVDRPNFKLLLYERLRLTHTYSIAVGRAGLETPAGLHHILAKQVNPSWYVPHSTWAGSLAGKVIPPGPQNPLVARWMAIDDQGDGIHGTNEPSSIGSAASHGCIRMLVSDVIQLYSLTPLGSPVYVI
jgi:lipoprotein-anchoring transpeptidase ErfK/SrfK